MKHPRVGVGVLIVKDNKILLGKRKNSHGASMWGPPGGHLEFGESLEDCGKREVLEETGIKLLSVHKYAFTNDIFIEEDKHYISIFMISNEFIGELQLLEPNKCEEWKWFDCNALPQNLFKPLVNLVAEKNILN